MLRPLLAAFAIATAFVAVIIAASHDRSASAAPVPCTPGVELIGFSEALNKTAFGGFPLTELSGLVRVGQSDTYYLVADRSGSVASHVFTVDIPVTDDAIGTPAVRAVTQLQRPDGASFTGLDFDGEAIALTANGDLVVASEGGSAPPLPGPNVRRFSPQGRFVTEYLVSPIFFVAPSGQGTDNMTFDSLAVGPGDRTMFTANEAALTGDGQTADLRVRSRLQSYKNFERAEQYYYLTESGRSAVDVGIVELIALTDTDLLVLERGFVAGQGNTVRVFRTSIAGAEDISGYGSLAAAGLSPLPKTLLFDLATCPASGATIPPGATQPNALLDNFEAFALGPELSGNRRAILLLGDDNSGANQTTRVVALAISNTLLGLQPTVRPPSTGNAGLAVAP